MTRPRAIASRWRSPPDRTPGSSSAFSASPRRSRRSERARRPAGAASGDDSRERHVLERAHPLEQVEELEHEPDVLPPQARTAVLVLAGERHPCQHDLAARRRVDAGDQLQQRRLPAPRRPDDRHELAGGDLEVDAAERPHRRLIGPEAPAEAVNSQDLVHGLS